MFPSFYRLDDRHIIDINSINAVECKNYDEESKTYRVLILIRGEYCYFNLTAYDWNRLQHHLLNRIERSAEL